jgi:putative transposase
VALVKPPKAHLGWRSRGYLPHYDAAWLLQHTVFGLADSIPKGARPPSTVHADRLLDAGYGECTLRHAACAEIVESALLHADGERYRLIAWCVMPNHVHVLIEQAEGHPLGDVVQEWKSITAHKINGVIGREGRLWRREYFDRFMRDSDHLTSTIEYVEMNPVRANLVDVASAWRFSSARWRLG